MDTQKYRCIMQYRIGTQKPTITTFFFAKTDRDALGRVVIFLEMWLGISIKAEKIKVSCEPSLIAGKNSNIVTASIHTSEKHIPALTAWFVLESDYQALLQKDKKDELVNALQGLDSKNSV